MSSPPGQRCPYAALGVPRSADASAIKRAFVEAAKKSHPDHLPSGSSAAERDAAAARFAAVADAYSILGDASKKAAFDRMGSASAFGGSTYYRSNAYNPYAGGFGPPSGSQRQQQRRRPPPSLLSGLLRLVLARSSRGDAWAHVALAAAALGGATLAATAGDDLWRVANKGKLFDDVVVERDRRRRKEEEEREGRGEVLGSASPAPAAAPAAAERAADEQQQPQAAE